MKNGKEQRIIVTGGAGFIGSALVRHIIKETQAQVCVVDKLTYAGNLESLAEVSDSLRYSFEKCDGEVPSIFPALRRVLAKALKQRHRQHTKAHIGFARYQRKIRRDMKIFCLPHLWQ